MEVKDFLTQNEVKFTTTSTELKKMLDRYAQSNDFLKEFKKLKVARSNEVMSTKAFLNFIQDNQDKLHDIHEEVVDLKSAICYVINEVIGSKETFKKEKKAERIVKAVSIPDYYEKQKMTDVQIDLFDLIDGKANKFDRDLYKCFCQAGEHIVFSSNDMTKLILQNNDGSLALGNDMLSNNERSLNNSIENSMEAEYVAYREKLKTLIASVSLEDLDIEENPTPVIEKIFLEEVPCSFRHIVNVYKRFKSGEDGSLHLDGFVVKPNKKVIDSLEFESFITTLSKQFLKMTRGALKYQEEYKAFSNRLDEAAVTHWVLPSDDCLKNSSLPRKWGEFFKGKATSRILQRLFWYVGAMQDANNDAAQALIISDKGGTGKSTFMDVMYKLFPEDFFGFISNSTLDDKKDFALSERKTYEHHCLVLDEYDGRSINGPVFKNIIGTKTPISMPVKNKQAINHSFRGTKMIVLSNETSILETHAFRRRVIPISFNRNHKGKDAFAKKDIDELIATGKDFLNFCYRFYKQCKCIKPNGEYYVLSPDMEEAFLKGEDLIFDEEMISLKAISNDDELSEFFNVRDYQETELSLDFQAFINEFLAIEKPYADSNKTKDQKIMPAKTLIGLTEKKLNSSDAERRRARILFGQGITSDKDGYICINPYSKPWWLFKEVLKTMGVDYRTVSQNGANIKAYIGLVAKETENEH